MNPSTLDPRPSARRLRVVFWIDLATAFLAGALLYVLLFPKAEAAELIIHGPSAHFRSDADYNNGNYGAGYAFDNGAVAGAYHNSLGRASVYAGYFVRFSDNAGVLLGAVTGYERLPVQPAAVATFSAPLGGPWRLHVNVAPFKSGFINLALGYRL